MDYLAHYGVGADNGAPGRGSGRYPKGSGKRPRAGKNFESDKKKYGGGPNTYGPIEETVMPKGTKLRSVSSTFINSDSYKNSGRPIYTYNKDNEWDNKVYKGPFAIWKALYTGAQFIAEFEFTTAKDFKMPTRQERIDEFKNLYNDRKYKNELKSVLLATQKILKMSNVGSEDSHKVNIRDLKTDSDFEKAYEVFNHSMEAQHKYKSTKEYIKRMSDRYDAMVDDNNQGIYDKANDPVIVFKTNHLINENGTMPIKFLKGEEMNENAEYVRDELLKRGEQFIL